jgi:hypothetical protein
MAVIGDPHVEKLDRFRLSRYPGFEPPGVLLLLPGDESENAAVRIISPSACPGMQNGNIIPV